jgi:HlyD family secretion protein
MAKNKNRKKILIFTVIGVVLVALTLTAIFRKKEAIVTVQTEKVIRTNLTELVMANGKIQPVTQVTISPEVAGEITVLPVKEGDHVKKGDLLLQIKPDNYQASRNSAEASYKSALGSKSLAQAQLDKAEAEYKRNLELFQNKLVSDSVFLDFKTLYDVAKLEYENSVHQADQAKFGLDKAMDDLSKTTIQAPIDGTVSRLNSQLGERVLGTSFNMGTEIMTIAALDEMEARVDIGEMDVVLIQPGQNVRLEVDAFKDRKFTGTVTNVANSSQSSSALAAASSSTSQEATKFQVRIRIKEKEMFRPGMSVTAEIETRSRTNALAVPFASVTARPPKAQKTNSPAASGSSTNVAKTGTNSTVVAQADPVLTNAATADKKSGDAKKNLDVVFVVDGDHVKMVPVKTGISDETRWEIVEGLKEGDEVVSGGFRAISRDLEDGKRIRKGSADKAKDEEKK